MKNETSWGAVSDWYDDLLETDDDSYQTKVILPHLMRIVQPRTGLTIFDNACGQGFFSRAFAQSGATVIASDISPELIKHAQSKKSENSSLPPTYHVAPAEALSFLATGSVDVSTIVLALQNIKQLEAVCFETARLLVPQGRFVIVLNHPSFRIPGQSEWGYDEITKTQYRRINRYMSESTTDIDMHPSNQSKITTVSFHRPLQVYIKALSKAGFVITRLEEWISHKKSQKGPRALAEDTARKEIPLFLCIEAQKKLQ